MGSYQDPLAVVDFMLDDLCCPAGKGLEPWLELLVLPLHFDGLEAFGVSDGWIVTLTEGLCKGFLQEGGSKFAGQ